jgi:hypothetical protein
MDRN